MFRKGPTSALPCWQRMEDGDIGGRWTVGAAMDGRPTSTWSCPGSTRLQRHNYFWTPTMDVVVCLANGLRCTDMCKLRECENKWGREREWSRDACVKTQPLVQFKPLSPGLTPAALYRRRCARRVICFSGRALERWMHHNIIDKLWQDLWASKLGQNLS